jgi:hypothetical protein
MLTLLVLLSALTLAAGQNASGIKAKYRYIVSYELRPDVLMTPRFSPDGAVCEMVLEKRQRTDDARVTFDAGFLPEEITELTSELVPESERGKNISDRLNSTIAGSLILTEYKYENVTIRVYGVVQKEPGGDRVIVIAWPKRSCEAGSNGVVR